MSWQASAWAKEQRLGSPAAKSILLCLADYANPETAACWPSQERLAADAEVSERTAREWLQRLEDWGLISRERRTKPNGARASDVIVLKLDARVQDGGERCREIKADADSLPANSAGRTYRQPDAEPTGNQTQPTGNQFRAYKEEPTKEQTSGTSQGAQARERGDLKLAEQAFWRLVKVWPGLRGMPKQGGLRAFLDLSPEDREEAERKFPHWLALLKSQGKDHVAAPSTYFGQKLFKEVVEPVERKPEFVDAPVFGPVWNGLRMEKLVFDEPMAGPPPRAFLAEQLARQDEVGHRERMARRATYGWPAVNHMHEQAAWRKGVSVAIARAEAIKPLMEPVPVGSETYQAWRALHEANGWPWIPDPGGMRVVFFPVGGPEGLEAFKAAIRGKQANDGDEREAAE